LVYLGEAAKAKLLPAALNPEQCYLVLLAGHQVGMEPLESLGAFFVVNGKVSMEAHTMLALVHRKGIGYVEFGECSTERAVVTGHNTKSGTSYRSEFTAEDAKTAGLWGKNDVWKKFPRNMLKWRALADCCRTCFPEMLGKVYTPDEAEAIDTPYTVTHETVEPYTGPPPRYVDPDAVLRAVEAAGLTYEQMAGILGKRPGWTVATVPVAWVDRLEELFGPPVEPEPEPDPDDAALREEAARAEAADAAPIPSSPGAGREYARQQQETPAEDGQPDLFAETQ